MNADIFNSYKNASLATDCKITPVILLYETAIKSLHKATKAIEDGDIEARFNNMKHATDIILGLKMALDFDNENTQKLSAILNDFYLRIERDLNAAQKNNDAQKCKDIIAELSQMKESWEYARSQNTQISSSQDDVASANIASINQSF